VTPARRKIVPVEESFLHTHERPFPWRLLHPFTEPITTKPKPLAGIGRGFRVEQEYQRRETVWRFPWARRPVRGRRLRVGHHVSANARDDLFGNRLGWHRIASAEEGWEVKRVGPPRAKAADEGEEQAGEPRDRPFQHVENRAAKIPNCAEHSDDPDERIVRR
jgi:hypothetical protein